MLKILDIRQFESRVEDCYSVIKSCRMASAEINDYLIKNIETEINRKHGARSVYCAYTKGFVKGLQRAQDNRIMREYVEFCYLENAILFSTHKNSAHRSTEEFFLAGRGCDLGNLPSGFYWKGTDKPYFIASESAAFQGPKP